MKATKYATPAFTLMEVVISMLITAVVIAICYAAFNIINQSYARFSRKNDELVSLSMMDHLLARDFARADRIYLSDNELIFGYRDTPIQWTMRNNYFVRNELRTDTFRFAAIDVSYGFEHQPLLSTSGLIDELSFFVIYQNEKIQYHYHKLYSSQILIQTHAHAFH